MIHVGVSMLVKVLSDTHNKHLELNVGEGDILIHCGDFTNEGKLGEVENFLLWFNKQNFKYKILVSGNHDKAIKKHPNAIRLYQDLGIHVLTNSGVTINDVTFWGGHQTPHFRSGINMSEIERLRNNDPNPWEAMPMETCVLITHAPPFGILDTNSRGEHIGCNLIAKEVQRVQPWMHLFGHVHEHNGKSLTFNATTYMNCSNLDLHHNVIRSYTEITLP